MSETILTFPAVPQDDAPQPEVRLTAEDIAEIRANYRRLNYRTQHWRPFFCRAIFNNTESAARHTDQEDRRFQSHVTEWGVDHEDNWADRLRSNPTIFSFNPTKEAQLIKKFFRMNGNGTTYGDGFEETSSDDAFSFIFGQLDQVDERHPDANRGFDIFDRVAGEDVDSSNWDQIVGAVKILSDPHGTRTTEELKHAVRKVFLDYILSDLWAEPVEAIAKSRGEKINTVEQRIIRARREVELMIGKICPTGTCPQNACMHVAAIDRDFYHFVFKLPEEESTKIIHEGGYYAFVKLDRYRLTRLEATTEDEAEVALDQLRQQSIDSAIERFPREVKDRARKALQVWDSTELPAGMPEDLLEKFTAISDAFDVPGVIRHLDPDPTYKP